MRNTKKAISVILAVLLVITTVAVSFSAYASTGTLCSYYATNPDGKVGIQKSITIDGNAADWSEDMLIAQGAAWDVANHYKGGHENCVLDTYALFATWDSTNLYVGWQMVNTTDTWARSGDGPLSDGGRVLDVPLILALSVNPNSTKMSNKNTDGNPIWGKRMGLSFDTHVDHLFYMSGKPGMGNPAMFTAVDAEGNTNYTTGCKEFTANGIQYKMATTNICSSIYGLNYSDEITDVYSDSADWVDFKTFAGSQGSHDTTYDSFYEMKIPLSVLGIDASYLTTYGIGAMLIATRGESGLDCIPYDDTMLDNATGDYYNDPSTSAEKHDEDVITSPLARIGTLSSDDPIVEPTTAPVTVAPTTAAPTVAPTTAAPTEPATDPSGDLVINAKSNLFDTKTVTFNGSSTDKKVTVEFDLKSALALANGQWSLSYDTGRLKLLTAKGDLTPNFSGMTNIYQNVVYGNFSSVSDMLDFTTEKAFVKAEFEVIGSGSADVTLNVEELSVGRVVNNKMYYKNAVAGGQRKDLSGDTNFQSNSITGKAQITLGSTTDDNLTITATSNLFPTSTYTLATGDTAATVNYTFTSTLPVNTAQWELTYDPAKLSFDKSKLSSLMPGIAGFSASETNTGTIKGYLSASDAVSFKTAKTFVEIPFTSLGTGTTNVNLNVKILGIENTAGDTAYLVSGSTVKDVTSQSGFSGESYSTKTTVTGNGTGALLGDVNLDGSVTVLDATLIQKHISYVSVLTDAQALANADTNKDGVITVSDATAVQRLIAGIITAF